MVARFKRLNFAIGARDHYAYLYILFSICASLLINLYYPVFGFFGYDAKRCVQILFVIFIHLALFDRSVYLIYVQQYIKLSPYILFLLVLLVVFSCIASIFSAHPIYSLGDWLHYLLLLNASFITAAIIHVIPWFRVILLGSLFFGFILLLLAFLFFGIFTLVLGGQPINAWEVYPNVANIRFLNQVHIQLLFFFPVFLMLIPPRYRLGVFVLGAVSSYMLFIGYSRGVILSLLVVYFFSLVIAIKYNNQTLKELLRYKGIMLLGGGVIYLLLESYYLFLDINLLEGHTLLRTHSERYVAWLEIIESVAKYPFGLGSYHYSGFSQYGFQFSHPHNFLLQILIEWGVIPLVVISVLLFLMVKRIFSHISFIDDPISLGLLMSFLLALCYSFFSGVLVMPGSQLTFVVIWGVLLSSGSVFGVKRFTEVVSAGDSKHFSRGKIALIGTLITTLVAYIYYAHYSYNLSLEYRPLGGKSEYEFKTTGPRMWLRGGIVVPVNSGDDGRRLSD